MRAAKVPFVGREAELTWLADMLARAAEQAPGAVLVGGEAGVGKTRLLREFAAMAQDRGARFLAGSCVALGCGELPYAPLFDALRRLTRHAGEATAALDELSDLLTAKAGATSQLLVFSAVLRLLDALSADGPVVLTFEDLHWADRSTLDLLAYLIRGLTDERVLLVGSYRSTDLADRHPLRAVIAQLDHARSVAHLELNRFDRAELQRFLAAVAGDRVDERQLERAFALSDGNAFFAEELVMAGLLAPADAGTTVLPRSLRDLILTQVELLGDDARGVMRVAATAGRRVSHRLLAAVSGLPGPRLHAALRECVSRQMLETVPEDDTYRFRHALLREAVHQDLLPGERIELHAAIAAAITADERLGFAEDVTLAAELSYHWYEARAVAPALAAAVRAGDTALRVRAFGEADLQYGRALQLWADVPDAAVVAGAPRDQVLSAAADAARWAGRVEEAVKLTRRALDDAGAADPARARELHERLGRYLWEAADTDGSRRAYAEAARLLDGRTPSAVAARVMAGQALAEVQAGKYSDGLRIANAAIEVARGVGAKVEQGRALNTAGVALTMAGRVDEGTAALRSALEIADATDMPEDLFRAYGNLMVCLENSGRLRESVEVALAGLDRARRSGLQHTRGGGVLANNASAVLAQLGRWDEAVALVADMVADRPPRETLYPRLTLAEVAVAQGRADEAETHLRAIREAGAAVRDPQFLGALAACETELLIWLHQPGKARSTVAAALAAVGDTEHHVVLLRLTALALRIEADERQRLTAARGGNAAAIAKVTADLAALEGSISRLGDRDLVPEARALRLLATAEYGRAGGGQGPESWAAVAEAWLDFGRVPPAAYAKWREAEAAIAHRNHPRATRAVREGHRMAMELGAGPLCRELESLAARARLELRETTRDEQTPRAEQPFGLTRREREVLSHLAAGHTNRHIARTLYITERTAGVHVSNILMKLGVANRGEAAAVAHRLNLIEDNQEGN